MPVTYEMLSLPEILTSILILVNPNDETSLRMLKMVSKKFRQAIQQLCKMRLSVYTSLETELRCIFEADEHVKISFEDDGINKQAQFESMGRKLIVYLTYPRGTTSVLYTTSTHDGHFLCFTPHGSRSGYANVYSSTWVPRYVNVGYRVRPIEILKQRNILEWVDDLL